MSFAIVAAHPDDEILGLGTLIPCLQGLSVIHITDGAPRNGEDARKAGCACWQDYAALRQQELKEALAAAKVPEAETFCFECPDQEAAFQIAENARRLAEILAEKQPVAVFTHAYEGGHPDHDATAASVHAAIAMLKRPCVLTEFAGYHAGPGGMESECFLDCGSPVISRAMTDGEREWKQRILNRFVSQALVFTQFPLRNEPLRAAPRYDFSRPPHDGPLYYDRHNWGITSAEWRAQAAVAFRQLDLPCVC